MKALFWIQSSKGTDGFSIVKLIDDVEDQLERWCSNYGYMDISETFVRYGYIIDHREMVTFLKNKIKENKIRLKSAIKHKFPGGKEYYEREIKKIENVIRGIKI